VDAASNTGRRSGAARTVASRLLACGVLSAAWLGCTAPARHTIAPGHEGAPGVRRVLVCSPNLVVALPVELTEAVVRVEQELVAALEARELEVERLELREGHQRWREAAAEARRQGAKDAAAPFVQGLAAEREFDALLMPALLLFNVRVTDSSGTWDGVRRRLATVNQPSLGGGGSADTFTKGVVYGGVTGDVLATSLHVLVFSRDGQRIYEGRGGLDFVQEADLADAHTLRWELRAKYRLLHDPELLRQGIDIALSPYLGSR